MADLPPISIIKSMRKTITMSMGEDGILVVKAPVYVTQKAIDTFIYENIDWIEKRRKTLEQRKPLKKKYIDGEKFFYLGKEVTLTLGNYTAISVDGDKLLFPIALQFRAKKELESWFVKQAKEVITRQVIWYAKQMNSQYKSISFSDTSSKWGSCTHDNRLQFNWRLVMASIMVINYVVVHELVHTVEKNHSRTFWSKVRLYNPSFNQQRKWLKANGHSLVFY